MILIFAGDFFVWNIFLSWPLVIAKFGILLTFAGFLSSLSHGLFNAILPFAVQGVNDC